MDFSYHIQGILAIVTVVSVILFLSSDWFVEWQETQAAENIGCIIKILVFLFILFIIFFNLYNGYWF